MTRGYKTRKDEWHPGHLKYLEANYHKMSAQLIADEIGRTRNAVIGMARRLGLAVPSDRPPIKQVPNKRSWSDEHRKFLMANYHRMKAPAIAHYVGKTTDAVYGEAKRLGLSFAMPYIQKARAASLAPTSVPIVRKAPAPPPPHVHRSVTIMELEKHHCREVVEQIPVPMFCALDQIEHSSYCAKHHAINYHRATPTMRKSF